MRFIKSSFVLLSSFAGVSAQIGRGSLMKLPNATALHNLNDRVDSRLPKGTTEAPSEFPTESPAPSPSPSEVPTNDPERITEAPSAYPTESPAPSPSPSEVPTIAPTESPSSAPSAGPTVSAAPSSGPTASPSAIPSDTPSMAPSSVPTTSAMPSQSPTISLMPSDMPSLAPSTKPSAMPSFAPSYSPTKETHKTKSSVSELILVNIPREMDDMTLARFEIATLEFMRQAQPPTKGYKVEILAVTVLAQTVVFPDHYETHSSPKKYADLKEDKERSLANTEQSVANTSPWDVALQVKFRTVAVVTEGRVPDDFDLADLAMYGLENHFNQYLWQLGNSNGFFAPLKEISDWPAQQESAVEKGGDGNKKKAGFVFVLLFSSIALGLAVFASYFAIRRHLQKNNRRRRKSGRKSKGGNSFSPKQKMEYSGEEIINYLTNSTNEDSTYHDGDVEGGGAIHFVKSIDSDDQSMESVGLTPKSARSIGTGFFEGDDASPLKSPMTMSSPKKDNATTSGVSFGLNSAKKKMKKWMTPRQSVENSNGVEPSNRFSVGSKSVRFDPPEKDTGAGRSTTPRRQSEPEAKKGGIYSESDGLEIVKNKTGDDGEFTLPISFFSGNGEDADSDFMCDGTPMSSLAGSNASSFFSNVGKTFAGRRSSTGAPPSLSGIPTNPTIKENYAFSEASAKFSSAPSTVVNNLRNTKQAIMSANMPKKQGPASEISDNSQSSRVQDLARQFMQRQAEANKVLSPHPAPRTKPFKNPHEGFETILGARSRSMEEDDVVQNMVPESQLEGHEFVKAPSSTPKNRRTYGYHFNQADDKSKQPASTAPASTLGARPMGSSFDDQKDERDDKSTLSAVMQRPGTYDVYAPSGPIGIVVDTSKDGPSVHSLKSTSPMLGLITAGDLIIALDNEDTRVLSAAELTRLMAKKSRQRERKITLYSVDGF